LHITTSYLHQASIRIMRVLSLIAMGLCASLRLCAASPFLARAENGFPVLEVPAGIDVQPDLFRAFGTIFGGWGPEALQRLTAIKASILPAFSVQQRSDGSTPGTGHLHAAAVRAVVYGYFAREHGWLIKGLEPPGTLHTGQELQDVVVLRKAPEFTEAISEIQRSGNGFTLGDVSALVAAMERLIVDESVALLESVYELNGEDLMDWLSEDRLHEVLKSYMLVFRLGAHADLSDPLKHQEMKARAKAKENSWKEITSFEVNVLQQFNGLAQDAPVPQMRQYSFEDVAEIVREMALRYGKFQDAECRAMTQELTSLDQSHSGHVALDIFHRQPRHPIYGYKFSESAEYLRHIGALNESNSKAPEVLIADYVNGPSNCIATSRYLSVCCLNECEVLMDQLERKVLAPAASSDVLMGVLREFSPNLESRHTDDLQAISVEGSIQLSSPEFARWMQRAFPEKCPTPLQAKEAAVSSTQSTWLRRMQQVQRPIVPPSHRPTHEDCTRVPEYFL